MPARTWTRRFNAALKSARPVLRAGYAMVRIAATTAWFLARTMLWLAVEILLALIILFEEWGWRPMAAALARLAHVKPIAAFEGWVSRLPPYGALAVFALPTLMLLPLKFLALFLIATGHKLIAGLLFLSAKIFGTAIVARLFHVAQNQLMQIGWFKSAYDRVMPWKEALIARVRESTVWKQGRVVKHQLKHALGPMIASLKARARAAVAGWRAGPGR